MSTFDQDDRPLILEAGRADHQYWLDLWRYRELFLILAWRDVAVRYKQTVIGVVWAFVRPFMTMVVFTVVFGSLAKLPTEGSAPYAVMVFAGLLPWTLFASVLQEASGSVIGSANLISKVYFPRLLVPLAAVIGGLADFGVALLLLLAVMVFYAVTPGIAILALPLLVLFAVATAFAVGLWLSALNVQYRDVRYTLVFATQLWMFATPVAYSASLVPEGWRALYGLNPMVGVVEGFRWALLNRSTAPGPEILVSIAAVAALLVSGLYYFRRVERTFADVI